MKKLLCGVVPVISILAISFAWAAEPAAVYDQSAEAEQARIAAIPANVAAATRRQVPPAPVPVMESVSDPEAVATATDTDTDTEIARIAAIPTGPGARPAASRFVMAPASGAMSSAAVTRMASVADNTPPPPAPEPEPVTQNSEICRQAYRDCMDQFCLADPLDGERCICSDAIVSARSLQNEVMSINDEALRMRTEGIERVQLGTRADLVFGTSGNRGRGNSAARQRQEELLNLFGAAPDLAQDTDELIGGLLLRAASNSCAARLAACGPDASMEEILYQRMIQTDCRTFNAYLEAQRREAQDNRRLAESEVRAARTAMLDVTDRFNRGECLLAFKDCVREKGGCGQEFENCADQNLIARRAHACENILDECNAVRRDVMNDWTAEVKHILAQVAINTDDNRRRSCRARTWSCLEESCSYATNAQCLTNVNVAAGICTVIDECEKMIPGFRVGIAAQLGEMRMRFCQNDATRCLQEQCGPNFMGAHCIGRSVSQIQALCRQDMFASCTGVTAAHFTNILTATLWQIDYNLMTGCVNHFAEQLGRICGTDMSCLPPNQEITLARNINDLEALFRPNAAGRTSLQDWADREVTNFMRELQRERTVRACAGNIGNNVFHATEMVARANAQERVIRQYFDKLGELAREVDEATRRRMCEETMFNRLTAGNSAHSVNDQISGAWIVSAIYEAPTRNCRVQRRQQVCGQEGVHRGDAAMRSAATGAMGGLAAGTAVAPGIGTIVGGVLGALGGGIAGHQTGGQRTECNSIIVYDNIAM
jgi:hypothetical protein